MQSPLLRIRRYLFTITGACYITGLMIYPAANALSKPTGKIIPHTSSTTLKIPPRVILSPEQTIDPELKQAMASAPTANQWPNNDYARILDSGIITVKPDGTVIGEYRETYKLFNERARRLAEVSLPYNASYQSPQVLRARTIKKSGNILVVKPQDIRTTSPYSDYPLYDDSQAVGFSMPGIEDECIIDYSYRMVSRPSILSGQFWTYWAFSGPEPVSISRVTFHIPITMPVNFKVYNDSTLKPTITTTPDGKVRNYVYEMTKIKPLELEPAMPGRNEVRIWLEVSSISSWQEIAKWFWGLAKPQATPTSAIRSTVNNLIIGKQTDNEKARAIYDFVANRIRYVGLEFGLSAFRPHAASDVHEKLYGDCKDKAMLLITMLGLIGIKAHPVLLYAEDKHPVHDQLPSLNGFNHCIAVTEIDGKEVWLDATAETCGYGDIPDGDRGSDAFVIRDGVGKFETIPVYLAEESGIESKLKVTLQPDGSAIVTATTQMNGAESQQWRATARSLTPDQRKQLMQTWAQTLSTGAVLKENTLPDGTDKTSPYVVNMKLTAPKLARKTQRLLLIPAVIGLRDSERSNPFVKELRIWPVVIDSPTMERSEIVLQLPDGYTVEEMPVDVSLKNALFEFKRKISLSADHKTIEMVTTILARPGRIPASEYAQVKTYYDDVIRTNDDLIVLRKL